MKLPPQEVTQILREIGAGNNAAPAELLPLVYDELRRLAASYLRRQRSGHTLQATALVHEAYIRLVDAENVTWQDRTHFFAVAATVMRHILVDHARKNSAEKRGGERQQVTLDERFESPQREVDVILLDDALNALAAFDPQQSKIVELRFFGGLTIEETAHALGISPATVKREWTVAKAWLYHEISR